MSRNDGKGHEGCRVDCLAVVQDAANYLLDPLLLSNAVFYMSFNYISCWILWYFWVVTPVVGWITGEQNFLISRTYFMLYGILNFCDVKFSCLVC